MNEKVSQLKEALEFGKAIWWLIALIFYGIFNVWSMKATVDKLDKTYIPRTEVEVKLESLQDSHVKLDAKVDKQDENLNKKIDKLLEYQLEHKDK